MGVHFCECVCVCVCVVRGGVGYKEVLEMINNPAVRLSPPYGSGVDGCRERPQKASEGVDPSLVGR